MKSELKRNEVTLYAKLDRSEYEMKSLLMLKKQDRDQRETGSSKCKIKS